MAGAEIVDRRRASPRLRNCSSLRTASVLWPISDALGDFDLEPCRRAGPVSASDRRRCDRRCRAFELARRDVDREDVDVDALRRARLSCARMPRASTHSPIWTIRPVFSASGMNRAGRGQTFGRAPAHQRLDAERLAGPQIAIERLELQHEFVALQRAPAAPSPSRAARAPRSSARLVEPDAAAGFLGDVKRGFGLLHQRVGVQLVVRANQVMPMSSPL